MRKLNEQHFRERASLSYEENSDVLSEAAYEKGNSKMVRRAFTRSPERRCLNGNEMDRCPFKRPFDFDHR